MDNWTLSSTGFDVGEEADDGGSRTTATLWEGRDCGEIGGAWGEKGKCAHMQEKRASVNIKEKT